jgi:hypothetical protein
VPGLRDNPGCRGDVRPCDFFPPDRFFERSGDFAAFLKGVMNIPRFTNLCTTLAALAAAAVVFAPAIRAADKAETAAAKKAKEDQANLEKYDRNHDGKLDDEEKAVMKADQEKAKAAKKEAAAEKKKQKEEVKKNGEN